MSFPLPGSSVASFYAAVTGGLAHLGVSLPIARPTPFDLPDATPFALDTTHTAYDPVWVGRYWRTLSRVALVLERHAAGFSGKVSPVHHFWHTMDIAVTRFSDVTVPHEVGTDPVTYTAPEPAGLVDQPLRPAAARWVPSRGAHLAVLRYDDALATEDPQKTVLTFLDSAYEAGARLAGWDLAALSCPDGVTDPHRRLG